MDKLYEILFIFLIVLISYILFSNKKGNYAAFDVIPFH